MTKTPNKRIKTPKTLPNLTPSEEQQTVVNHMSNGHNVVVDACAGSGKSTTILSVAVAHPTKKILQITYNAALRKEFKEKVHEYGLNNVDVHTYHSLAVQYFSSDAHTDSGIRRVLRDRLIRNSKHDQEEKDDEDENTVIPPYDILVLDEAQDMTSLYFRLVLYLLDFICPKKERGIGRPRKPHKVQLLILGDWMQGLYEFKGADIRFLTMGPELWSACAHLKTPIFQRCTLSTSYRITRHMASFVNQVLLGCPTHAPRLHACKDGVPVIYMRNNRATLERVVVYHIQKILEEGDLPSDIFILGASVKGAKSNVRKMENALVEKGIPCHVPMLENEKMDERVIHGKVVFSTFHSVKGRQRKYVFLVGFDQSYFTYFARNLPEDQCPNTLYVGCTRATHRMYLLENHDHAMDQPLKFLHMTHHQLRDADFVDFKGHPKNIFYEKDPLVAAAEAVEAAMKAHIHYVSVTEVIKFIPEHVLDIVTPLLEHLFVSVKEEEEVGEEVGEKVEEKIDILKREDIPSVVYFPSSGLFEDVADLNGIALPCLFWDRMNIDEDETDENEYTSTSTQENTHNNTLYTLIGTMLSDVRDQDHIYLKRKYRDFDPNLRRSVADYLYLANLYVAVQEKLYFKMTQIADHEYDWLPETVVESCMERMTHLIGKETLVANEHVLVHPKMETEHVLIDQILRPFFGEKERYRFSARLDLLTETSVWEIKCTHQLTTDHLLQVVLYAWLWRMIREDGGSDLASPKKIKILNVRGGELLELRATTDELTHIVVELLRGKYATPVTLSDNQFLLENTTHVP